MELLRVAAPAMGAMASYTAMQFVDSWLVSRLGPMHLAAQGNGGLAAWLPTSTAFGVLLVVNSFVSQNLGAGTPRKGSAYAWNGLWLALAVSLVMAAGMPFLRPAFRLMGHDEALIDLETPYAMVLIAGAFFNLASRGLSQFFYGVHRPMVVLFASVVANALNIALSYALIFGKFGAPRLELLGAGIGTVIAGALEFAIPFALYLSKDFHEKYGTRAAWRLSSKCLKDLLRVGWPGGVQVGNEMLCWFAIMVWLIGSFGPAHNAAGWIALRWTTVAFMPAFGMQQAVTAVVGRYVGAGDFRSASARAWLAAALAMAYMGTCALLMVIFREPLVRFFLDDSLPADQAAEIVRVGALMMICAALFQVFDALGLVLVGALRGAGDTVWPGIATLILSWTCLLGLGAAITFVLFPSLGGIGPWIAVGVYIALLGVTMGVRWRSGRWRKYALVEASRGARPPEDPIEAAGPAAVEAVAGVPPLEPRLRSPGSPGGPEAS